MDSRPQGIASVFGLSWGWWKAEEAMGHYVVVCVYFGCVLH